MLTILEEIRDILSQSSIHRRRSSSTTMSKLLHAPTDLLSSHFVCRTSELQGIQDGFSSLLGSAPSRIILWGMPGVGKTQLALRYAVSQYNTKYTHVFWVSASTTAKIYQALESFLDELDSPDRYSTEQHIKLTAARKWLEDESYGTERSWLLVFDNANRDTVATIRDVIPKSNRRGNILITTKGQDVAEALSMTAGEGCPCYEVQTPDEQDAAIMLLDIASMRAAQDAEMLQQATQLVKQLGCLPLAIGHVASFMRRSRIGLQGMLDILSSEEKTKVCSRTESHCVN